MTKAELTAYSLFEIIKEFLDIGGMKLVLTRNGYECLPENSEESDDCLVLFRNKSIQSMWFEDPMDLVDWILSEKSAWVQTAMDVEENHCSAERLEFLQSLL